MPTKQKKILIVDDDPNFRQLLSEIFKANGFETTAVRCAKDGTEALDNSVGMMIVDYRLPDTDGMTFISQVREAGKQVPIVFITGTFCDAKTFSWLRNILNVSLVLQKPIQPNCIIQQLEGLLPVRVDQPTIEEPPAASKSVIAETEYEKLLLAAAGIDTGNTFAFESKSSSPSDSDFGNGQDVDLFTHVSQMRQKLAVEEKIRHAQAELRKTIPPQWQELSLSIAKLQQDKNDAHSHKQAIDVAHRLRGTAGSLGLSRVSICAGKLEDYLKMIDPNAAQEHELLWGEIFRALADGELGLSDSVDNVEINNPHVLRVLIVANESTWTNSLLTPPVNTEFVYALSPTDAVLQASSNNFDVGIIDLEACPKSHLAHLAKALRATSSHNNLPLGCVAHPDESIDVIDVAYIGISAVIERPLEQIQVGKIIQRLARTRQIHEPRILTVDDDTVLTRFIQTVLRAEGMNVSTLNEPIKILETLEECEPELLLLDVMMPGLSGYDVCRLLRDRDKWKTVPIIFLTSKSDAQGRAAAFQAGGSDFLSKPILSLELTARVKGQLERANPQRQARILDEMTGLLKREIFWSRFQALTTEAQKSGEPLTLSFISIDDYGALARYGLFVELAVVAALGKLLSVRFKSEVLRGRWNENTFALAISGEERGVIEEALQIFAKEAQQIPFTAEMGERFEVRVTTATGSYPEDGKNLSFLAESLLPSNRAKQAGGHFSSQFNLPEETS